MVRIILVMRMDNTRNIVNLNSYGNISIHLKELMDQKGITRYRLAKLADTRFEVVDKWCSGTVERIDADVLARFCYILNCQITDIVKYNP